MPDLSPTAKVLVDIDGDRRVLSFHSDRKSAAAFADGIAWGVSLAGGSLIQGPDDAVWRGQVDGRRVRMSVADLPSGTVELADEVYEAAFGAML